MGCRPSLGTRKRRRVTLLVACIGLSAAACAGTDEPSPPPIAEARGSVQAMLRERARNLQAGDVEGYLRPLSPEARPVEEPIARGSTAVPLEGINLVMDEADIDLSGTSVQAARVDFIYRYRGIPDDNLFRFRLVYDLALRDGSWAVTKSTVDRKVEPLPVWATGPVQVSESPHFVALARPGLPRVQEVLGLAERAREALVPRLQLEADPRHLVVLARNQAEYQQFVRTPALARTTALTEYVFSQSRGHGARAEGRKMSVNLEPVLRLAAKVEDHGPQHGARGNGSPRTRPPSGPDIPVGSELTAGQVFQHELGHLALARVTRPSTPGWVVEGGAMLLAGERRINSWKVGTARGVFENLSFSQMGGYDALVDSGEYAYANAAVSYLVEAFGEQKFWEFYRDFKEFQGDEPHPLEQRLADGTRRLLRRIYELNEDQLDARTRDYIRRQAAN